jgi:hypothetical protein
MDWPFSLKTSKDLKKKWELIPNDVNVLIKHTHPHGCLDTENGKQLACPE